ncbi:hypothetical protein HDU76_002391 [Blyttiomyces sp. JEL0837]|nr:hypothetical protein HDU76_002391 [Blyttiomyces sp. JEL0837]
MDGHSEELALQLLLDNRDGLVMLLNGQNPNDDTNNDSFDVDPYRLEGILDDETYARMLQQGNDGHQHHDSYEFEGLLDDEAYARLLQQDEEERALRTSKDSDDVPTLNPDDPFPDIHQLFMAFDEQFFEGKLKHVEVTWSKKMTLCAGTCSYFRGGYCRVALSEPLLKFRPKSDYINTLLHELIHAYLFITQGNTDRDGHGPAFLNIAERINQSEGTNITVYHTFRDEVQHYRKHVWKCQGPCGHILRRAMNRPPQPADPWFSNHQQKCGGTYIKISEPEKVDKKKRKQEQDADTGKKKKEKVDDDGSVATSKKSSKSKEKKEKDIKEKKTGMKDISVYMIKGDKSASESKAGPSSISQSGQSSRDVVDLTLSPQKPDIPTNSPVIPSYPCPLCSKLFLESDMNAHLDSCLD